MTAINSVSTFHGFRAIVYYLVSFITLYLVQLPTLSEFDTGVLFQIAFNTNRLGCCGV
jgi:hypothetical protein